MTDPHEVIARLRDSVRLVMAEWHERGRRLACPACHREIRSGHADDCPHGSWIQMVRQAADTIESLLTQLAWRDIASAPKDGTHVLLYAPAGTFQGKPTESRLTYGYWDVPEHGAYHGDCGGECRCPEYDEPPDPWWYSEDGGFTAENPPTLWKPIIAPLAPLPQQEQQA